MLNHLSHATLDIIGLAGFNYSINALSNQHNDLSESFNAILRSTDGIPIFQLLKSQIPMLRRVLTFDRASRNTQDARKRMDAIGRVLVQWKKEDIRAEQAGGEDGLGKSKDLLSLLIKSNMDETGGGLTDNEVLDQIPTFLLAGTSRPQHHP